MPAFYYNCYAEMSAILITGEVSLQLCFQD